MDSECNCQPLLPPLLAERLATKEVQVQLSQVASQVEVLEWLDTILGETLPFTAAATGALIAAAIPSANGASTRGGGATSSSSRTYFRS